MDWVLNKSMACDCHSLKNAVVFVDFSVPFFPVVFKFVKFAFVCALKACCSVIGDERSWIQSNHIWNAIAPSHWVCVPSHNECSLAMALRSSLLESFRFISAFVCRLVEFVCAIQFAPLWAIWCVHVNYSCRFSNRFNAPASNNSRAK